MLNILLTGIGGQGTVLAAKLLAQSAHSKGWKVRTAETIGMAQRGGSVVSHVRIATDNEIVNEPLVAEGSADLIISFEPSEALRVLPYLRKGGMLITASSPVQPVSAALTKKTYKSEEVLSYLGEVVPRFLAVDDLTLCERAGGRKVLNTLLLAITLSEANVGIGVDDLRDALKTRMKESYVDMNLKAIEIALSSLEPSSYDRS